MLSTTPPPDLLCLAVYGHAVGDALGVPYEFHPRGTFTCTGMVGGGTHHQPAGTWSDDTSMMLATLDSLTQCNGLVDDTDLRNRYKQWLYDGEYAIGHRVFDSGITVRTALRQGRGLPGRFDNGNGALMRILPCAFFGLTDDAIRQASAITHAHPISMDACVAYVHAARTLINGGTPLDAAHSIGLGALESMPREQVESTGYVVHTLHAALWCLLHSQDYPSAVLGAVNLGDDTDTTAACTGALAAIHYGYVPDNWILELRGKEIIDRIILNHMPAGA